MRSYWVALAGTMIAGAAAAQGGAPDAGFGAEMAACGALANDAARHSCTDAALRKAGLMAPPQARAAERRRTFGLQVPSVHLARGPKAARTEAPVADGEEASDTITVTLDKVSLRGDGRLVVTTTEGAVWSQLEMEPVRPTPARGQSMTIERTIPSGFMCQSGRWTAFRCSREP